MPATPRLLTKITHWGNTLSGASSFGAGKQEFVGNLTCPLDADQEDKQQPKDGKQSKNSSADPRRGPGRCGERIGRLLVNWSCPAQRRQRDPTKQFGSLLALFGYLAFPGRSLGSRFGVRRLLRALLADIELFSTYPDLLQGLQKIVINLYQYRLVFCHLVCNSYEIQLIGLSLTSQI